MLEEYPLPAEMPKVFIDDEGIINVIFDTIVITPAHIVHGAALQEKAFPGKKISDNDRW